MVQGRRIEGEGPCGRWRDGKRAGRDRRPAPLPGLCRVQRDGDRGIERHVLGIVLWYRALDVVADHVALAPQPQHQVKRRLLLDVVVGQRAAVLKHFATEDQALLVRRDGRLVPDLRLDALDRFAALHLEGDLLARQRLHEDGDATAQPQHQVKR